MSNAKYTAAGYARYIGRVGALAVALGIGVGLVAPEILCRFWRRDQ